MRPHRDVRHSRTKNKLAEADACQALNQTRKFSCGTCSCCCVCPWCCRPTTTRSYAALAAELSLTASEVHGAFGRALALQLALKNERGRPRARVDALRLFVRRGARCCLPAKRGLLTRGVPTGYAAPTLNKIHRSPASEPPPGAWVTTSMAALFSWELPSYALVITDPDQLASLGHRAVASHGVRCRLPAPCPAIPAPGLRAPHRVSPAA